MVEQRESSTLKNNIYLFVDPLTGAIAITEHVKVNIVFGKVPDIFINHGSLFNRQPKATLLESYQNNQDSQQIAAIINSRQELKKLKPLPFSRGDISVDGTRGFKAVVQDLSDRVICFTGIGIVRGKGNGHGGIDEESPKLLIDPPDHEEKYHSICK